MDSAFPDQFLAVQQAIDLLNESGVPYAVTGSWVVSSYGILRNTHDLDLVVSLDVGAVARLTRIFSWPRYYVDEAAIEEAVTRQSFFNILDTETTLKIDFWLLGADDYSQTQFMRREKQAMAGRAVWMLTPEDIILAKLRWFQMSESERQWRDVETVWVTKRNVIDLAYLKLWAARLSLTDLLARITDNA